MTEERIIQRAIGTAKYLRRAATTSDRMECYDTAKRMREGATAIEALVGLLRQKETAPGGDAPRAESGVGH